MKRRPLALALLAGGMTATSLTFGVGIAQADPVDPFTPGPGVIDRIITETPDLYASPRDEVGPSKRSDRVGMVCQNLYARCR
ncbi:hypothetical protein [Mycobacterium sp. 1245805.9]|uniref:hypothetical protein n=1 Tax=Mycobacterium sp. 1245805.9 TaxID=1856862 RepID=UPI00080125AE|nr:hypothetical protein [Mycobacterium sp. 1245805.9]OBI92958.1 hypothetical protein A9X00_14705 [Mycobacterium sp. 1245805.9]